MTPYITPQGQYYEASDDVRLDAGDTPVPVRPDPTYVWNGAAWNPTAATTNAPILAQISALEGTVTQRRLREAMLGTDGGWLAGVNTQIATLRTTLVK